MSRDGIGLRRTRNRRRRRLNRPGFRAVATSIAALVVGGAVLWAIGSAAFGGSAGGGSDPGTSEPAAAGTSPTGDCPSIGDRVELGVGDMQTVPIAREDALDRMIESAAADDTLGYKLEMLAGGTLVDAGTEARVLDVGFSRLKVRITEGLKRGRAGWIVSAWIGC